MEEAIAVLACRPETEAHVPRIERLLHRVHEGNRLRHVIRFSFFTKVGDVTGELSNSFARLPRIMRIRLNFSFVLFFIRNKV